MTTGTPSLSPITVPAFSTPELPAFGRDAQVTQVLPEDDAVEFDVNLTESTFLGRSVPDAAAFDMSSIDLDLKSPELEMPAPVKASAAEAAPVLAHVPESTAEAFDVQVSTAVNPEFNMEQVETVVNPSFGVEDDAFADRNFSLEQAETMVNPNFGAETELAPGFDITSNEEVTTKRSGQGRRKWAILKVRANSCRKC